MFRFQDRSQAGQYLASQLKPYAGDPKAIVLGLPRGGVIVAYELARILKLPLDVFLVRKLGTPGNEELAMGAIASGGIRVMNEDVVRELRISNAAIEAVAMKEGVELRRREEAYREKRPPLDVEGRTVIVVDDGLATGATMRAAVLALKKLAPRRLVVAVPTAAPDTCDAFREEVDEIICGMTPEPFYGVGAWYEQFPQNTDDEVRERLVDSDRGAGKK